MTCIRESVELRGGGAHGGGRDGGSGVCRLCQRIGCGGLRGGSGGKKEEEDRERENSRMMVPSGCVTH